MFHDVSIFGKSFMISCLLGDSYQFASPPMLDWANHFPEKKDPLIRLGPSRYPPNSQTTTFQTCLATQEINKTTIKSTQKNHHQMTFKTSTRFFLLASVFSLEKKVQEQDGETALILEYCCEETLHSIVKQTYPGGRTTRSMGEGVWFGGKGVFFFVARWVFFNTGSRCLVICLFWQKNNGPKKNNGKTSKRGFSKKERLVCHWNKSGGNRSELDLKGEQCSFCPGWLFYIEDYAPQLYRDYDKPI